MSFSDILGAYPPQAWTGIFAALFGLLLGSFAGLASWRMPRDIPIDRPQSRCPQCEIPIPWYRNLPLFTFALQLGMTACCKQRIHWRYPACEAGMATLAVLAWMAFGFSVVALGAVLLCVFLVILAAIDIEHESLPDNLTIPLLWLGLGFSLIPKSLPGALAYTLPFASTEQAVLGAICGYAILRIIIELWWLLRNEEGMGMGDAKLMAALGAWFGLQSLPGILIVASVGGAAFGVLKLILRKGGLKQTLPFGPFLAAGGLFVLFYRGESTRFWEEWVDEMAWFFL